MIARGLGLLVVAVVAFWPQAGFPDWKGTEGRRVQIAMEMVESGDFMVPTLGGEPTLAKPPLFYWILAGLQEMFGPAYMVMRLPSVLGFWLLAWLAAELFRRRFGKPAGWIAGLMVLSSPVLLHDGPTAEIDPLFSALTAGSLLLVGYGAAWGRWVALLAAGALGGLALLTKGPPYLLFAAFPFLVWWRHRRFGGFWAYALPLALVPLCYYLPLWLLRVGPAEFAEVAGEESVGRLLFMEWDRVLKTPVYLLRACLLMLPFGLWSVYEFRSSRDARMREADLLLRFCTSAAVGGVLLLAFFPGRPTRYLLPAVPLFLFSVAPAVSHYASVQREIGRLPRRLLAAVGAIAAVALLVVPFLPYPLPGRVPALLVALALGVVLVSSQRHLVAYFVIVPLIGAWTALPDRGEHFLASGRARGPLAKVLVPELERRGALDDLQTFGHFHSAILVEAGILPPGDEWQRRPPAARWVLYEQHLRASERSPELDGYVERLRLLASDRCFVLAERAGGR